ncbi:zinc finger protein 816-like [Contarinia nasturtii]|uniref:zinc finger protein 816-like n=1 Tax=Contarinia nasturtii TaxID=265458 RepID=UPI0012D3B241|nr:zinc finger protein 816-like [Contarinia nasturtii]
MSAIVHECLFCPQTFGADFEKDDHILEHFAQETCMECNQKLLRIGGNLYTLHNAVTCIKRELKTERYHKTCSQTNQSLVLIDSHQESYSVCYEEVADAIDSQVTIKAEELEVIEESNDFVQHSNSRLPSCEIYETSRSVFATNQANQIHVTNAINDHSINQTNTNLHRIKCSACEKTFPNRNGLKRHTRLYHDAYCTKFNCEYCRRVFLSESSLNTHYNYCTKKGKIDIERNGIAIVYNKPEKSKVTLVDCSICGKIYNKKVELGRHMRLMHDPSCTKFNCKYCNYLLLSRSALEIHFKNCKRRKKLESQCGNEVAGNAQQGQNTQVNANEYIKPFGHEKNPQIENDYSLIEEMNIKREPEINI